MKNTTTVFDKEVKRVRQPRTVCFVFESPLTDVLQIYGRDRLIRAYTPKEVTASCFLNREGKINISGHQVGCLCLVHLLSALARCSLSRTTITWR